jgi:hypothetical protein
MAGKKRKTSFIRMILDKLRPAPKPEPPTEPVPGDGFATLDYQDGQRNAENELAEELRAAFDLYSKVICYFGFW